MEQQSIWRDSDEILLQDLLQDAVGQHTDIGWLRSRVKSRTGDEGFSSTGWLACAFSSSPTVGFHLGNFHLPQNQEEYWWKELTAADYRWASFQFTDSDKEILGHAFAKEWDYHTLSERVKPLGISTQAWLTGASEAFRDHPIFKTAGLVPSNTHQWWQNLLRIQQVHAHQLKARNPGPGSDVPLGTVLAGNNNPRGSRQDRTVNAQTGGVYQGAGQAAYVFQQDDRNLMGAALVERWDYATLRGKLALRHVSPKQWLTAAFSAHSGHPIFQQTGQVTEPVEQWWDTLRRIQQQHTSNASRNTGQDGTANSTGTQTVGVKRKHAVDRTESAKRKRMNITDDTVIAAANAIANGTSRMLRRTLSAALSGDLIPEIASHLGQHHTAPDKALRKLGKEMGLAGFTGEEVRITIFRLGQGSRIKNPGTYVRKPNAADISDDSIIRAAAALTNDRLRLILSAALSGHKQKTIRQTLGEHGHTVGDSLKLLGSKLGLAGIEPDEVRKRIYSLLGRINDPGTYKPYFERRALKPTVVSDDSIIRAAAALTNDRLRLILSAALSGDSQKTIGQTIELQGVAKSLTTLGEGLGLIGVAPSAVHQRILGLRGRGIIDPGTYQAYVAQRDLNAVVVSDDSIIRAAAALTNDRLRLILSAALSGHNQTTMARNLGMADTTLDAALTSLGTKLGLIGLPPETVRLRILGLRGRGIVNPGTYNQNPPT